MPRRVVHFQDGEPYLEATYGPRTLYPLRCDRRSTYDRRYVTTDFSAVTCRKCRQYIGQEEERDRNATINAEAARASLPDNHPLAVFYDNVIDKRLFKVRIDGGGKV